MSQEMQAAEKTRRGTRDKSLFWKQTQGLTWPFWVANIMEMTERLAYYGVRVVIPIYIAQADAIGGLHFSQSEKGFIFMWWALVQKERKYHFVELSQPLEILALAGNISLKDGQPFVHAHITLSDQEGRAFGGHLAEGTRVFACEFTIQEGHAPVTLARSFDEETGLFLWPQM
jgi:predicted DNA-binding protein with PD1-like motif